jgi:ABC-2 type transport system permease protein
LLAVGRLAYGVSVPLHSLLALTITIAVGTFTFCSLGFAASGFIKNVDAAQPVMMAIALPLFFISGIFVPWPFIPSWLHAVADAFPVRHFASAVLAPLTPAAGSGIRLADLAVVAVWGAAGLFVAARSFRWTPST